MMLSQETVFPATQHFTQHLKEREFHFDIQTSH